MTKRIPSLIVLAIALLLPACCPLTSVHPLSSPTHVSCDERLQGVWRLQTEHDDVVYFHIGKTDDGRTQITSVEHKRNGELDIANFVMFPTSIDKNTYMSLKIMNMSGQLFKNATDYFLLKYAFANKNAFFVYQMDDEVITEAIMSETLKGEITYRLPFSNKKSARQSERMVDCVKITDATENIVRYIRTMDTNRLFPEKDQMVFQRIGTY